MIRSLTTVQSVSRCAGGMFDGVRRLSQCMAELDVVSDVYSLRDDFTDIDINQWAELRPRVCKAIGPYGFSPELMAAVMACREADMAHGHGLWNYSGISIYKWAHRYNRPYIVSPHGMLNPPALRCSRWKKLLYGRMFERRYLDSSACIRALSVFEAASIRDYDLRNPICIIPNGVDIPEREVARSWSGEQKILLYLGRLHKGKNLERLIRAWSVALKEKTGLSEEWVLKIVGWGQSGYEQKMRVLISELGIDESVIFPGPKYEDDKTTVYASASAFILPSLFEGSPISLLEAWAHGLPVLMTPACNLAEGFERDAAIMISSGVESIVGGIIKMVSMTDEQRAAMGNNGLRLVREKYQWSNVALNMKRVYDWILGRAEQPACVEL